MNPSSDSKILRMGTRRSLLALAQSGWVAREIERSNPGVRVEVVGIDTRGDKILDVPLTSVQGKEFFVAELDDALKSGRVDFTVHSMKDLSLDRPQEFVLGAVPTRENQRDIIIFGAHTLAKIARGEPLLIGTSSPRRLENLPGFLRQALPWRDGREAQLKFVEIRGNVNTRLSRLREEPSSDRHLDAVVLALAGLNRLMVDENGARELGQLLVSTRLMLLPVTENPAAAAQGALAVECRKEDSFVQGCLEKIHHEPTRVQAALERAVLQEWGGGCHQRFGASAIDHPELGTLLYIKGKRPTGEDANELRWQAPVLTGGPSWDGSRFRASASSQNEQEQRESLQRISEASPLSPVFIAHHRAVVSETSPFLKEWVDALSDKRVWVSGTASWFQLARHGIWVEGCAEGFGAERALQEWLSARALRLPVLSSWWVLTHTGADATWKGITADRRLTAYSLNLEKKSPQAVEELKSARHVFWASGSQWEIYGKEARLDATHACGPGKTAELLRKKGLKPYLFPNSEEWRKSLGAKS